MVVGITGGIGTGKSLVSKAFCLLDNTVYYHADEEAKSLMNTSLVIKNKIIEVFGEDSYQKNKLNRKYISSFVFKDPKLLKRLNRIVHPIVKKHFINFVKKQNKNTFIIYENAILFETGSNLVCDIVISVNAPKNLRVKRVMERDHVSEKQVLGRMKNQWPNIKRNLLSNYIVYNIEKEETLLKINYIYKILTKKILLT
tara:strand:+ start:10835 stop:11431 length:597 start_codon:yes stop_codon:yes gene_type:complete